MSLGDIKLLGGQSLPDPWAALGTELRRVQEDRGRASAREVARAVSFRQFVELTPDARGPLDTKRFRYQSQLLEDWMNADREAAFMKGNQVGASSLLLRWAMMQAAVYGRTVIYSMPTDRMLAGFSRRRVAPVVAASPWLREQLPAGATANVGDRQLGSGWLLFRGLQQPVEEIDADALVVDEHDLSEPANVEATERRLSGPQSAGLLRRLGIPSVPGYGIAAYFDASDQRVWTVKCRACGTWNPMRGAEAFAANVDQDALAIVCRDCRRRLRVQQDGEWIAAYPSRDVRGYHMPRFIVPGARLDKIVEASRRTHPQARQDFYCRELAEPYAPEENRLSLEQIRACVRDDLRLPASIGAYDERLICLGCDVASVRNLSIVIEEIVDQNVGRRIWAGELDDGPDGTAFEQLCDLMRRFNVTMACIDRAPERRFSEAFAAAFPGKVYLVGYKTPAPSTRATTWDVDDDEHMATLWRTLALDATLERFRTRAIELPPLSMLPANYPAQLGALVRQIVELPGGQVRAEYRSIGADDLAQAECYCLCAVELLWRRLGMQRVLNAPAVPVLEPGEWIDLTGYDADGVRYGL